MMLIATRVAQMIRVICTEIAIFFLLSVFVDLLVVFDAGKPLHTSTIGALPAPNRFNFAPFYCGISGAIHLHFGQ